MTSKNNSSKTDSSKIAGRLKTIENLADILDAHNLSSLSLEDDSFKTTLAKLPPANNQPPHTQNTAPNIPPPQTPAQKPILDSPNVVKSPVVGVAYLSPEPDASPFVRPGDPVQKGQTVLIVEAMKTMNHISSPRNGEILEILVDDAQPVEFDAPLFSLKSP